ncbi:DUF5677 domain-containing protein [Paraburkholderia xenovorans]|uniref:DUF5677 domain-containing protein n=1 Tax=Paraburkholderia xenovorans TaxID=36873 RepID=UPI0038BD3770
MDDTIQLLSIVEGIYAALYADIDSLRFSYGSEQPPHAMILYLRTLELANSALMLVKAGHIPATRIVTRPLISAVADLINLATDREYHTRMACTTSNESARLIKRVIDDARPDSSLTRLIERYGLVQQQQRYAKELSAYKSAGVSPLSDFERFRRAGMLDSYFTDYWLLSLETHNDLKLLQGHHVDARTAVPRVVYDKPVVQQEAENCIWAIGTSLFRAALAIKRVVAGVSVDRIADLFAELWKWEKRLQGGSDSML